MISNTSGSQMQGKEKKLPSEQVHRGEDVRAPPKTDPILRRGTRVLMPREYRLLREQLNPTYQVISDALLNTGMRVEEFWFFIGHPEWYKPARRCITLLPEAIRKEKQTFTQRDILLTVKGCQVIEILVALKLKHKVSRSSMREAYRLAATKAGIGTEGITTKMFRKTCVSWLLKTVPELTFDISSSMGHNLETMRRNYANIAFMKEDMEEMREYFKGWGN